jgi:hypothetical protein
MTQKIAPSPDDSSEVSFSDEGPRCESCWRKKERLSNSSKKAASKECLWSRKGISKLKTRKRLPSPDNNSGRESYQLQLACLQSVRLNERRARDAEVELDTAPEERDINCANAAGTEKDPATSPADETTKVVLNLERIGRPEIEAKSEDDVPKEKTRDRPIKIAEQMNLRE